MATTKRKNLRVRPWVNHIIWETATDRGCDTGPQPILSEDRERIGYLDDHLRLKSENKKKNPKNNSPLVCGFKKCTTTSCNSNYEYLEECPEDEISEIVLTH